VNYWSWICYFGFIGRDMDINNRYVRGMDNLGTS